jgi:hypothetical protein
MPAKLIDLAQLPTPWRSSSRCCLPMLGGLTSRQIYVQMCRRFQRNSAQVAMGSYELVSVSTSEG